ncbi:hypothetical protein H2248_002247 [Termitomyces sp. 'cryptogamus']|nr:hypothetical protein H2248_002247 [Termitomyces sp. 'cryptogamus']
MIPLPPVTIPKTALIEPQIMKKSTVTSKQLQPKDEVVTAWNLYLIDYLASYPNTTKGEFAAAWKSCNGLTKENYQQLLKEQTKIQKKGDQPTKNSLHAMPMLTHTNKNYCIS